MENIKKPKIVLLVDQPNWAFAISAADMIKYLGDKYDFKIINYYEKPNDPSHYTDADLIYTFGYYMKNWLPDTIDMSKVCTGIRSMFGHVDDMNKENHDQDPWTAEAAKVILEYPIIHAVSQETLEMFKDFHPNVEYACHGVDTSFYTQKLDYTRTGKLRIGWAGNIGNPVKGMGLIKDAMVGRTDTELFTAEFGSNQLTKEQLRDFYHSLDVFILPSISEGVSAAMLEALSCGLPIIATDTGGWKDVKDKCGGYTMLRTHRSFNEALDYMHSLGAKELKELGDKNRREMVEHWDWSIKAKEFDKFFQKALGLKKVSDKTKKIFEDKWKAMPKGYGMRDMKQLDFFLTWAVKKYGMRNLDELNEFYANKKNILEIGFGSAFNLNYISKKTSAKITGVDSSPRACELARELFKGNDNVTIINQDILKFKPEERFDLIIADGVLHHLRNTFEGIEYLYDLLVQNGNMYVYLYRKMGKIREFTNNYINFLCQKQSTDESIRMMYPITKFGEQLSKIKTKIKIDEIPMLGLKAGEYTPHEIFYYGVMKCFWNDVFSFEENNLNNFDWFSPEHMHRTTEEEVGGWMKRLGCNYKINDANLNGISLLIKKP